MLSTSFCASFPSRFFSFLPLSFTAYLSSTADFSLWSFCALHIFTSLAPSPWLWATTSVPRFSCWPTVSSQHCPLRALVPMSPAQQLIYLREVYREVFELNWWDCQLFEKCSRKLGILTLIVGCWNLLVWKSIFSTMILIWKVINKPNVFTLETLK